MRMRTSLRERRRQVIYVVPNLLTTGNLFCGLYAIMAVFGANYMKAAIAILVALVFDMLDGQSARWTKTTSQFGIEYDSLADLVSFGVAPGMLIYSWALSSYGLVGLAVVFAFVGCGALRLARYNVLGHGRQPPFHGASDPGGGRHDSLAYAAGPSHPALGSRGQAGPDPDRDVRPGLLDGQHDQVHEVQGHEAPGRRGVHVSGVGRHRGHADCGGDCGLGADQPG